MAPSPSTHVNHYTDHASQYAIKLHRATALFSSVLQDTGTKTMHFHWRSQVSRKGLTCSSQWCCTMLQRLL